MNLIHLFLSEATAPVTHSISSEKQCKVYYQDIEINHLVFSKIRWLQPQTKTWYFTLCHHLFKKKCRSSVWINRPHDSIACKTTLAVIIWNSLFDCICLSHWCGGKDQQPFQEDPSDFCVHIVEGSKLF